MSHIEIEVARYAGVCYGVERALGMAEKAADEARKPVNTLGPLIHNPLVVNDLESIGVGTASSVSEVEEGTLIIRAHGVVPSVVEDARTRGLDVLDATCPYVKKVHNAAERLVCEGYQLIVVGESGHPEVEGIMGHAGDDAHVVSVPGDLDAIDLSRKVGVVVQTTQTPGALADVVAELSKRTMDLRVINTICSATQERQDSAAELARRVDAMIVVGGYIAQVKLRAFVSDLAVYKMAVLRLVVAPLLYLALVWLLRPDETLLMSTVIQAATPVAANCVLFAVQYDSDAELASKSVAVSTALSVVTIPLLTVLVQALL